MNRTRSRSVVRSNSPRKFSMRNHWRRFFTIGDHIGGLHVMIDCSVVIIYLIKPHQIGVFGINRNIKLPTGGFVIPDISPVFKHPIEIGLSVFSQNGQLNMKNNRIHELSPICRAAL